MEHDKFFANINGQRIRYKTKGVGTPVIFINNFYMNADNWGHFTSQVERPH